MLCPICSKSTPKRRAKFCSRACWLQHTRRNVEVRRCLVCELPFVPSAPAKKAGMGRYCSRACAGIGRRTTGIYRTRMEWYNSHGWQTFSKNLRKNRACEDCASTDRLTIHHKCDPFPTRDIHLLLSRNNLEILCYRCHFRRHRPPVSSTCPVCRERFEHAPSKRQKFCSAACRWRQQGKRKRRCKHCRRLFMPDRPEAMHCSLSCAAQSTAAIKKARRVRFICPVCSKPFTMPPCQARRGIAQPCCSRPCANELRRHRSA